MNNRRLPYQSSPPFSARHDRGVVPRSLVVQPIAPGRRAPLRQLRELGNDGRHSTRSACRANRDDLGAALVRGPPNAGGPPKADPGAGELGIASAGASKQRRLNRARSGHATAGTIMTDQGMYSEVSALAAYFRSERVTRIEPALSAWESVRLRPSTWPDLRVGVSASDRERPLVAGAHRPVNGTPAMRCGGSPCWWREDHVASA